MTKKKSKINEKNTKKTYNKSYLLDLISSCEFQLEGSNICQPHTHTHIEYTDGVSVPYTDDKLCPA